MLCYIELGVYTHANLLMYLPLRWTGENNHYLLYLTATSGESSFATFSAMQRLKTLPRESFRKIFQLLPENEISSMGKTVVFELSLSETITLLPNALSLHALILATVLLLMSHFCLNTL